MVVKNAEDCLGEFKDREIRRNCRDFEGLETHDLPPSINSKRVNDGEGGCSTTQHPPAAADTKVWKRSTCCVSAGRS